MKFLFFTLTILLSFSAFSSIDTTFYVGDSVTLKSTKDIVIPAEKLEVRTSCGLLLQVDPKTKQRTFKKEREFTMEITSNTRFWTRSEITDGTTMFKKAFFQANSFEKFEGLIDNCPELEIISIDAIEEEEEEK